ncbi:NADPH-dependent FMN reductase [Chungangia koreensis]|uniref:NADPH-dependent FMN reductase n=1 Tax=Chungangia koreensis TaxID=752657 RepID=A0ABV8X9K2_9LACT
MKIAAIVGSIRKESLNKQLALTIKDRYTEQFELEILDIASLPFYNQDEENNPPQVVVDFKKKVSEADAVLIFTPEFNWSFPGVLKNALDWLSRVDFVLRGKAVHIAGVSGGPLGTIRAQLQLRQVLTGMRANMMHPAGNEILIGSAGQKFSDGRLTDEATLTFLDGVMEKFIAHVQTSK